MQAVLLDGMGTLLALQAPWPLLCAALCRERGIELGESHAEQAFRAEMSYYRAHHCEGRDAPSLRGLRRRCAEVLHAALPEAVAVQLAVVELEPLMLAALRFDPYPEVPSVLAALRDRGLRLVVVSNWDVSLHEVLAATGLRAQVNGVVCSAEVGHAKPAAEIFRAALEVAGVEPEQALHVGDSPECDVTGALAAGIAPILVQRGGKLAAGERLVVPSDSGSPLRSVAPTIASLEGLLALIA